MFNRLVKGLVKGAATTAVVGTAITGIARPAQAGPQCLPYVTDSGQIVVICRQEAAAEEDRRSRFPGGLVGAPPEARQEALKAEAEKDSNLRGSGR